MVSVPTELLLVAGIVIFGFLSERFFQRTGVPSFLFLIFIGILLGPVLNIFSRSTLVSSLSIFAELTLLIVLFYGGMDTKFDALVQGGGRAFLQVLLYVVPSTIGLGLVISILLGWSPLLSLIFASIVGGETTAAVVVPLSRSLRLTDGTVAFLTLESAMNSVFSIILFFAFVGAYNTGASDVVVTISSIVANFSIGIVVGAVLSLAWVVLLNRWKTQRYTYVFTMGLIFLTYSVTTLVGGSGELAVLIFGIVLGNYTIINHVVKAKVNMDPLTSQLRLFHGEISFLLETLFFVSLGITFIIDPSLLFDNILISLSMLGMLMLVRASSITLTTYKSPMRADRRIMVMMCAQGLTPATLAILAVNMGLPNANAFLNLVTYVIIFTNVITSIGSILTIRKNKYPVVQFFGGLEAYT
jgi:Na+:H+ antiporter